ncbi:protein of unknown function [Paraburkholderia kururiensis]
MSLLARWRNQAGWTSTELDLGPRLPHRRGMPGVFTGTRMARGQTGPPAIPDRFAPVEAGRATQRGEPKA